MTSFEKFISTFNEDKKGQQFERFILWFFKTNPEWSARIKKVWLWEDFPKRWGRDKGIDLVFKDKDNKLCAVQAKCYDQKYSISKSDVDKFLSESNRKLINYRLLISTTDRLNKNANDVIKNQEKKVIKFLNSDFEKSKISYPSSYQSLNSTKKIKKPKPFLHQKLAINDVCNKFKKNSRGQLIMACGTGKTFTSLWIKERIKSQKTIIFVPSLSLLSQTLREWCYASKEITNILCVCSDKSVSNKLSEDENIQSINDLSFPVTSDVKEISKFLKKIGDKIIFSTYQSSDLIAQCCKKDNKIIFDLIIADEAHKCVGKKGDMFVQPLDNKLIKSKKRLFTTATPRFHAKNIKKISHDKGIEIYGMDDEKFFGPVFHELTFGEAIKKKLLAEYQVVVPVVTNETVKKMIDKRVLLRNSKNKISDAKSYATKIAVLKTLKKEKIFKSLSFHNRISNAKKFSDEIIKTNDELSSKHKLSGKIYSDFVEGKMNAYDRKIKINQIKELNEYKYGMLSNARCLQEGVDIPSLDGISFIDPRGSHVDIVQAVGRAIRSSNKKNKGTIIVPVFVNELKEDLKDNIEKSGFKNVWDVLNALRSHDKTLSYELETIRTELGKRDGRYNIKNFKKIKFDLPEKINPEFVNSIKIEILIRSSLTFNYYFGQLINYQKKYKNLLVPASYTTPSGDPLGRIVNDYRTRYKGTRSGGRRLNNYQISKLNSLKHWIWDKWDYDWQLGFDYLNKFFKKNGHLNVKQDYETEDGYRLGIWIANQRNNYRDKTIKKKEYITKLERMPGWVWNKNDADFNEGIEQLKKFINANKHTEVKENYVDKDGYRLGPFVKTLRTRKKSDKNPSKLTKLKFKKVEELKYWFWDKTEKLNLTATNSYKEFVKNKKEFIVPNNYIDRNGFKLGRWFSSMKSAQRRGKLTKPIAKFFLNYPGWDVNAVEKEWLDNFQKLKLFKTKYGHTNVKHDFIFKGLRLGRWIILQRSRFNRSKEPPLKNYQIKLLKEVKLRLKHLDSL